MALLDFLNSPQLALGAGLLAPTDSGSLGAGLIQGLSAQQSQRQSNDLSMLAQSNEQAGQNAFADTARFQQGLQGANIPLGPQNAGQLNAVS